MGINTKVQKREELRRYLVCATGNCDIQEGADGKGWPCGACVRHLLSEVGLDATKPEYQERNDEHDRHNEVWRAILQIRAADLEVES